MAYSYVNYPGDGETRIYAVPFPFMERGYVHVRLLDGLTEREIPQQDIEWLSDSSVRLPEPAPPPGVLVKIQRETEREKPVTDFCNGAALTEQDLDNQTLQLLHIAQEAFDALTNNSLVEAAEEYARQAAESARKAEHALAETIETKNAAIRDIRKETDVQKDRLQAVADTTIITVSREADRAHNEAERAEQEADRAATIATLAVGCENLEATWTLTEDIPAGGLLTLPDTLLYFPGRNMLHLGFEGITCYPGLHYEEVPLTRPLDCPATTEKDACPAGKLEAFPELPSGQIRLLFAAAKGTVVHAWIIASNVAKNVEKAEEEAGQARDEAKKHADRACECAELSCACADEAEKAKDTAVNAAQDAQDSADRADDAAADAEKAAQAALAAHCHLGIASVLEDAVLSKPLPHGFYTLNPHIVLPATCSLPLYPVEDGDHILSGVEGFYLFAPRDPNCDPNNPDDKPTPPNPNPDGHILLCGQRRKVSY